VVIQPNPTRQTESNEPVFLESGFATNNGWCGARPYLTASLFGSIFSNAFILDATTPPPDEMRLGVSGGFVWIATLVFRDLSFSRSRAPNSVGAVTSLAGSAPAPQEFVEDSVTSR